MADNVTNPIEGLAFIEFNLELPNQNSNLTLRQVGHETSTIFETVFDYGYSEISFRVTDTLYLDQVVKLLESQGNPRLRFRWGIGAGANVLWTPWQEHYVYSYQAVFESIGPAAGHFIKFHTRDLLHLIDRSNRTKAYRGSISTIVRNLASTDGFTASVIEDTSGESVWVQSYEGDFEFVRKRLINRARSTRGRGNYYLFVRDNVLHFHTVDYQAAIHDFSYYKSPAYRLEALDLAQSKLKEGSAGVSVVYLDPYAGISKEVNSDPNQAIRFANSIPTLSNIPGAQRNIVEHKIQTRNDEAGVVALGQNAYECARSESFQLRFQTSKTPILRPGDLLRISLDPNSSTTSSWGGTYLIGSARHTIVKGEITSIYLLQRGEQQVAKASNNALAAYGIDTLQDQQNAPGHDINTQSVQSSSLITGAGQTTSSGIYSTVQDSNSAPLQPNVA